MSQDEFCRNREVGRSTLSRYLSLKKKKQQPKATSSQFVPVEVVKKTQKADEGSSGLLLVTAHGHRIEVRSRFEEATLRQLLDVLERR